MEEEILKDLINKRQSAIDHGARRYTIKKIEKDLFDYFLELKKKDILFYSEMAFKYHGEIEWPWLRTVFRNVCKAARLGHQPAMDIIDRILPETVLDKELPVTSEDWEQKTASLSREQSTLFALCMAWETLLFFESSVNHPLPRRVFSSMIDCLQNPNKQNIEAAQLNATKVEHFCDANTKPGSPRFYSLIVIWKALKTAGSTQIKFAQERAAATASEMITFYEVIYENKLEELESAKKNLAELLAKIIMNYPMASLLPKIN